MKSVKIEDNHFIKFQDDFYNLLEKYGVENIDIEHQRYNAILDIRNEVYDFILAEICEESLTKCANSIANWQKNKGVKK